MPRGDRSGPAGAGPMTGRGVGFCGGGNAPGYFNRPGWSGGGYVFGRGGGGWRHRHYAAGAPYWGWRGYAERPPSPGEELAALKKHSEWLEQELEGISKRIEELESD